MWCLSVLNAVRSTVVSAGDLVNNMASTLQVCEPLCFIQSNIEMGNIPKSAVQTMLIGFYTDEDICNAKELLFSFAEKCSPKIDDLPRNRLRRTGESKCRLDVEDLLFLYDFSRQKEDFFSTYIRCIVLKLPAVCSFWWNGSLPACWVRQCKYKYKSAIKNAELEFELNLDDEISQLYLKKDMDKLWNKI